jgi:hypothetical protein
VGIPVIVSPAVGQAIIDICKKPGRLQVPWRLLTPPDPYEAVLLISRITHNLKTFGHRIIYAIGRNDGDLAGGVIFQAVKRALDMVSDYLALAELYAPVDTFVPKTIHFPAAVPPEDELFSHPDHTHRFISDLGGVHNYIPLFRNHMTPARLRIKSDLYSPLWLAYQHIITKFQGLSNGSQITPGPHYASKCIK